MILPIGRRRNRPGYTPHLSKGAGYTLIELILLTVIIAILVGISAPLFRRTFSDLELKEASFNIARLISFAQEKSIIEGTPYKLVLDKDKARYYLTRSDPERPAKFIRLKERWGRVFSLPGNIRLTSNKKEIIFYPDGHSEKASITFLGRRKSIKINLKGNLGYVEIKEPL